MADVIADLIARIETALGRDGTRVTLSEIERKARQEWGGRWVYVAQRIGHQERDALIVEALRRGEQPMAVAQAYGLSVRWVRHIYHKGGK